MAVLASLFVSMIFAVGILLYIVLSRLYSYRGVRLKQYPFIGYAVVVASQGGLTYWLVYHATHQPQTIHVPWTGVIASSLLIGGFYPLTQVYQHESDKRDGVETISARLGIRGTFRFCAVMYFLAFACLAWLFTMSLEIRQFFVLQILMLPVLIMFFRWAAQVWKDPSKADFEHTMRMNWLASICTNTAFFILLIWRLFE